jgi:hypothetical protein
VPEPALFELVNYRQEEGKETEGKKSRVAPYDFYSCSCSSSVHQNSFFIKPTERRVACARRPRTPLWHSKYLGFMTHFEPAHSGAIDSCFSATCPRFRCAGMSPQTRLRYPTRHLPKSHPVWDARGRLGFARVERPESQKRMLAAACALLTQLARRGMPAGETALMRLAPFRRCNL